LLWSLYWAGRFQEETGVARAMLARQPTDTTLAQFLCLADAGAGQIPEAREMENRLRNLQKDNDSGFDLEKCNFHVDVAAREFAEARKIEEEWISEYPDKRHADFIGDSYVLLNDFGSASDWFEKAYARRESFLFRLFYQKNYEKYRATPGYKALARKPLFVEWQARHDRIAAALAAHRDPLQ
jgi:hypothetical protein